MFDDKEVKDKQDERDRIDRMRKDNIKNDERLPKKHKTEQLKALPNFDADIFKEISGIDINDNTKTIVIDGKEIEISNESYEAFKKQFIQEV